MNSDNTQKLYDNFPALFRNRDRTCMLYGFCVGDGWYNLIRCLLAAIAAEAEKQGIGTDSDKYPVVSEVKEKFGGLRFSVRIFRTPEIGLMIEQAADLASRICEMCGVTDETVMMRSDGYQFGYCAACSKVHYPTAKPLAEFYKKQELLEKRRRGS